MCDPTTTDTPEDLSAPVTIHTDGACSGNPGPGGWAAVLERPKLPEDAPERSLELHGGDPWTTNNRMELMAPIKALECLKGTGRNAHIITDSKYVLKGITEWLPGWKAKGWKTSAGKPVLNADLWERLEAAVGKHQVSWEWTKGHDGNPGNERADVLARQEVTRLQRWGNQPWRNTH
ncbi:ribonuclease HI [Oleispirillum naphthae]|uniref:ribonuclease HI n=1 Tax=Oleispirillum naphthae TaxID=2838853 RepID=UPI00308236AD